MDLQEKYLKKCEKLEQEYKKAVNNLSLSKERVERTKLAYQEAIAKLTIFLSEQTGDSPRKMVEKLLNNKASEETLADNETEEKVEEKIEEKKESDSDEKTYTL